MNGDARIPDRPYKGLARFDDSELDERFFFGRDRETELVAANLVASRLTVLYGPSGVGKSSLLRAGVVRRLRALVPAGGGASDGDGALPVVVDQWRDDPLAAIAAAAGARCARDRRRSSPTRWRSASAEVGGEIYLVLDQMEEYFVYHGRDRGGPLREALAEILDPTDTARARSARHPRRRARRAGRVQGPGARACSGTSSGSTISTSTRRARRSSSRSPSSRRWAGRASTRSPRWSRPSSTRSPPGGSSAGSRAAGSSTGRRARGRVEAPYLQLVMERLWEVERERGSDVLRAETLAELGGRAGSSQQHLERALAGLDEPERELVARLFHQLVTPSGTKIAHAVGDLSRYAGEPPERLEDVLHALSTERVVRALPARNGGGAALRDLPRRPCRSRARLGRAARGRARARRGARGGAAAAPAAGGDHRLGARRAGADGTC